MDLSSNPGDRRASFHVGSWSSDEMHDVPDVKFEIQRLSSITKGYRILPLHILMLPNAYVLHTCEPVDKDEPRSHARYL